MKWGKVAVIFTALFLVFGCAMDGPSQEMSIKERLDAKLKNYIEGIEPLGGLGCFGDYFTDKYNGRAYMHERHAQFNWVVPALTQKVWQENAKTRSWMLGQHGYVMPVK